MVCNWHAFKLKYNFYYANLVGLKVSIRLGPGGSECQKSGVVLLLVRVFVTKCLTPAHGILQHQHSYIFILYYTFFWRLAFRWFLSPNLHTLMSHDTEGFIDLGRKITLNFPQQSLPVTVWTCSISTYMKICAHLSVILPSTPPWHSRFSHCRCSLCLLSTPRIQKQY